jgi:multicomponent Na+:H+ antiporter subunit F
MTDPVMIARTIMAVAFCCAFVRLLKGPSLADRVVAMDLMSTIAVGAICLYSIWSDRYEFTDAALVLALIMFLSTIAFSYYLEKKGGGS